MARMRTAAMRQAVEGLIRQGKKISLVPTMGALHKGHASLIRRSAAEGVTTVASVFVNPTQFGPNEDFDRYPRTPDADVELAVKAGADIVWLPSVTDLYPSALTGDGTSPRLGVAGSMHVCAGPMGDELCGASRPGFFDGVCTVVLKLFQLSRAHEAHFGEKDWQQLVILRSMVREFHLDVEVHGAPILRDPDGLAMSSRNRYLRPEQRAAALALSRTIGLAQTEFAAGERSSERLARTLRAHWEVEESRAGGALRLDYLELREPQSLLASPRLSESTRLIMAAYLGEPSVRLIDNAELCPQCQ
jgi:pantoate--beta-alanine ligase